MAANDPNVRLRVFALLLRYGHELFAADGLEAAATAAVNNAHEIVPFETSSIFEYSAARCLPLAQYGQPKVNEHAALVLSQADSIREWVKDESASIEGEEGRIRRIVKLQLPTSSANEGVDFLWVLEFKEEPPASLADIMKLIGSSAGQALAYHRFCRPHKRGLFGHIRKSTFWGIVAIALAASMFIRVPETNTTEFSVCAPKETTIYAWFDGAIAECLKKDGQRVEKGDIVMKYDVSQLSYRTALARSQLEETKAELALARQNAFANPEELGRVKLLEVRCKGLGVSVEEAEWYLEHSNVRAPTSGVVTFTEGDVARIENKAVRTGDELFRVLGGEGFEAEILVNEREASVLRGDLEATLFLHTAPETAIPAKVLEISHYPQLTEQKTWAYRVKVRLDDSVAPKELLYGMRGIAKLKSGDVSLGYRLFKSGVLYVRGL